MRQLTEDRSAEYPVRRNRDAGTAGLLTRGFTPHPAFPASDASGMIGTGLLTYSCGDSRGIACRGVPRSLDGPAG